MRHLWFVLLAGLSIAPAAANEKITAGAVGSSSAAHWLMDIAVTQGMFARRGIDMDLVYGQSNAGVTQQLAAESLQITFSSGLVDPIRAVSQGAPLALVRIESQASPYALLAKPDFTSLAQLKGHIIIVGGAKDITRTYLERMLTPAGLGRGSYDLIYAGATSARMAALVSGAVDAALIAPPFMFTAQAAGYHNLGFAVDSARDLPFSGSVVNRHWAADHRPLLDGYLAALVEAVTWFNNDENRDQAVDMLVHAAKSDRAEAVASYDLFRRLDMFSHDVAVTARQIQPLVAVLQENGDLPAGFDAERLLLPAEAK
jgi:NitT/TauT family transport system substrate-binding protein